MTGSLTVVGAGAGSGKTTKICEIVAERIVAGLDPSLVLATTFTRTAAAEMKGRIQAALLAESSLSTEARIRMSERLELAAIGTVHSVGHTLLRKYAIPLGLSPRLEVMEEGGKARHLKRLLTQSDPDEWVKLDSVARRLGHSKTHELVLTLLDAKRGNDIGDLAFRAQLKAGSARLRELLLLPGGDTEDGSLDAIYDLARKALGAIRAVTDTTKTTKTAEEKLAAMIGSRSGRWQDCLTLKKLTAGKKSGADSSLADLRAAAGRVRRFKGLHDDVTAFVDLLTERALNLDRAYARYKEERGLLDFTDLEVLLLDLLSRDDLADTLRADFELVLVDEFQDTNPIQLAIFENLRRLAAESVWVGDEKQAIYGFRGTDSRLMHEVWALTPKGCRENLPKNYRSQAGLVAIVGELFEPLFGAEARLEAHHAPEERGVERWLLGVRNYEQEAAALADGVRELLAEGISARDIAILTRTNNRARTFATALTAAGVPASLSLPGLLSTREGALLLAGLRLVADRRDSLAAATIVHLLSDPEATTPDWLGERLGSVRRDEGQLPWDGHEVLEPLRAIDPRALPPLDATIAVMDALDLAEKISAWEDPSRRAQNLDALCALAREYEEGSTEMGAAATLTGLIRVFEKSADDGEDHRPAPRGTDAVTLMTYHGAKGLQWPVVILSDLDQGRDPDLWRPAPCGGEVKDGKPLQNREIRFWPWPLGVSAVQFAKRLRGSGLQADALASPEGDEAIRLDREESARLLYVGFTRARRKVVLAHRPGKCRWLELLPGIEAIFAGEPGEHPRADFGTSLVVRQIVPPGADEEPPAPVPTAHSWRRDTDRVTADHPARLRAPSSAAPLETSISVHSEPLPGPHPFPAKTRPEKETETGLAIHACLATLPTLRNATPIEKATIAARCLRSFGAEGEVLPEALVAAGERLTQWVESRFPGATWLTEVPVIGIRPDGGSWSGSIDLLLRLDEFRVIVIDHKSTPVPQSVWAKHVRKYSGQLLAYRDALESAGQTVEELWIHFPLGGGVAGFGRTRTEPHGSGQGGASER